MRHGDAALGAEIRIGRNMCAAIGQHELPLSAIQPGHGLLAVRLFLCANPAGLCEVAIRNVAGYRQHGGGTSQIAAFDEQVADGFVRQDFIFCGIEFRPHFHRLFIERRADRIARGEEHSGISQFVAHGRQGKDGGGRHGKV